MSNDQEILLEQAALEEALRQQQAADLDDAVQQAIDIAADDLEISKAQDEATLEQANSTPQFDQSGVTESIIQAGVTLATGAASVLFAQNMDSITNRNANSDEFDIEDHNASFGRKQDIYNGAAHIGGGDNAEFQNTKLHKSIADQGGEKFSAAFTNGNDRDEDNATSRIIRAQQLDIIAEQAFQAQQELQRQIELWEDLQRQREANWAEQEELRNDIAEVEEDIADKEQELEDNQAEQQDVEAEIDANTAEAAGIADDALDALGHTEPIEARLNNGQLAKISRNEDGTFSATNSQGHAIQAEQHALREAWLEGAKDRMEQAQETGVDAQGQPLSAQTAEQLEHSISRIDALTQANQTLGERLKALEAEENQLKEDLSDLYSQKDDLESRLQAKIEEDSELAARQDEIEPDILAATEGSTDPEIIALRERLLAANAAIDQKTDELDNVQIDSDQGFEALKANSSSLQIARDAEANSIDINGMSDAEFKQYIEDNPDAGIEAIQRIEQIELQKQAQEAVSEISNINSDIAFSETLIDDWKQDLEDYKANEVTIERDGTQYSVEWNYDLDRYEGIAEDGSKFSLTDEENTYADEQWQAGKFDAGDIASLEETIANEERYIEESKIEIENLNEVLAAAGYNDQAIIDFNVQASRVSSLQEDLIEAQSNEIKIEKDGVQFSVEWNSEQSRYEGIAEDGSKFALTDEENNLANDQWFDFKYDAAEIRNIEQELATAQDELTSIQSDLSNNLANLPEDESTLTDGTEANIASSEEFNLGLTSDFNLNSGSLLDPNNSALTLGLNDSYSYGNTLFDSSLDTELDFNSFSLYDNSFSFDSWSSQNSDLFSSDYSVPLLSYSLNDTPPLSISDTELQEITNIDIAPDTESTSKLEDTDASLEENSPQESSYSLKQDGVMTVTVNVNGNDQEMMVAEDDATGEYVGIDSEGNIHELSTWQRFTLYSQDITGGETLNELNEDQTLSEIKELAGEDLKYENRLAAASETDPEGSIQADNISGDFQQAATGETSTDQTNDPEINPEQDPNYQQAQQQTYTSGPM